MDTLKTLASTLIAALAAFLDALIEFIAPPSTPSPEPPPPPPPPSPVDPIKVVVKPGEKAVFHVFDERDVSGKPIFYIFKDENGNVIRYDEGTIFTVFPEPDYGTGMLKMWRLFFHPKFYIKADSVMKYGDQP